MNRSSSRLRTTFAGFIAVSLVAMLGSFAPGCSPNLGGGGGGTTLTTAPPTGRPSERVGVMIPRVAGSVDADFMAAEANLLGVSLLRAGQTVAQPVALAQSLADRGERVIMAIKARNDNQPPRTEPELAEYAANLSARLDEFEPEVLVIENEEVNDEFFNGTPDEYLAELRAAATVAQDAGVPVTNGGLPSRVVGLVTWNQIRLTEGTAAADRFVTAVFDAPDTKWMAEDLVGVAATDSDPYSHLRQAVQAERAREAEYLLDNYGTDPGDVPLDYVNFHWYTTDDIGGFTTADADAFRKVIETLEVRTGRPVVALEIGQWGRTSEAVTEMLDIAIDDADLDWVLWYDSDDVQGIHADALHDRDAAGNPVLRSNGRSFAGWVAAR